MWMKIKGLYLFLFKTYSFSRTAIYFFKETKHFVNSQYFGRFMYAFIFFIFLNNTFTEHPIVYLNTILYFDMGNLNFVVVYSFCSSTWTAFLIHINIEIILNLFLPYFCIKKIIGF